MTNYRILLRGILSTFLFLISLSFALTVLDTGETVTCRYRETQEKPITILNESLVTVAVRINVNAMLPTENKSAFCRLVRVATPDIEIGPETEYNFPVIIAPERTLPTGSYTYWLEISEPTTAGYQVSAVPVKIIVE
jgi:hypothetical protein